MTGEHITISVFTEEYSNPFEELDKLICPQDTDMEVGYLKINPERLPLIMSEEKSESAIQRFSGNDIHLSLLDDRYSMITDNRSIEAHPGEIRLYGNAFFVRKQKDGYTGLTLPEVAELMAFLDGKRMTIKTDRADLAVYCIPGEQEEKDEGI